MILIFERGLSLTLKRKLIEIFDMIPVFEKALRLALQKKLHETLQTILVFERALKQSPLQLLYKSNHKRPIKNQNNLQSLMQVLL